MTNTPVIEPPKVSVFQWIHVHWANIVWISVLVLFLANIAYLLWPTPPSTALIRALPASSVASQTDFATGSDADILAGLNEIQASTPSKTRARAHSTGKVLKKVNLNTASYGDLQHLPNVGPAMARKILAYRKQIGKFSSVEQLLEVPGIGPKKLAKMKPYCLL
jgi:comEA protein